MSILRPHDMGTHADALLSLKKKWAVRDPRPVAEKLAGDYLIA